MEVRARRRLALGARGQELENLPAAGLHLGPHRLAGQGERQIDRALGDAVALGAHAQHLQLAQLRLGG